MPTLEVRDLCFRDRGPYSFRIHGGECVGLQGVSGAGKSLLLRALADLDPRSGTLLLGGVDADSLHRAAMAAADRAAAGGKRLVA